MTQAEKLGALVQKAVDNGLKPTNYAWIPEDKQALLGYWLTADNYKSVIFSHNFARALFGECTDWYEPFIGEYRVPQNGMEHHLQQAVVSDNPIDYMYEVVFGDKGE